MKYEFIEHTADIQFKSYGESLEESFSNAAEALVHTICYDPIKSTKIKKIKIKGNDLENLLYNFLEELVFLFDSEQFILSKIKNMKINQKTFELVAELVGDSAEKYEIYSHIKAITYNDMFVKNESGGWTCQVILDV